MADKQELAGLLEEIATLLELSGENPFKIRAYQNAAAAIASLPDAIDSLSETGKAEHVKGIGKTIGPQVREYLRTGAIGYRDELKAAVPKILFELVRIPGLGPKKAGLLYQSLGIQSLGELEYACRENRLVTLRGFGSKTQDSVLRGIEYMKRSQDRFILGEAWPLAEKIAEYLRHHGEIETVRVAGGIRRRAETVKDIDMVVATVRPDRVFHILSAMPGIGQIAENGPGGIKAVLATGMELDIRIVPPEQFAGALHFATGSRRHLEKLREYAAAVNKEILAVPADEHEIYRSLGLSYIPPELREGEDEIEKAGKEEIPQLVGMPDIQGAFHVHTSYSDGSGTLADMVQAAVQSGWSYLGISDHSQTAVYARGLRPEVVLAQRREIEQINTDNPGFTVFAGIESDILPDGSLDYPDEILARFDFVVASVHSAFRMDRTDMTRRITVAMKNRYVTMLGHPTGRILLARPGYAVDMPAIIDTASGTGTIIEINASPYRLDLDWRWCRHAHDKGVMLSVNPDAHAPGELNYVKFGIAAARKGWLTPEDILNTRDRAAVCKILAQKRSR